MGRLPRHPDRETVAGPKSCHPERSEGSFLCRGRLPTIPIGKPLLDLRAVILNEVKDLSCVGDGFHAIPIEKPLLDLRAVILNEVKDLSCVWDGFLAAPTGNPCNHSIID